jgi:aminoglycoside phosphotransferase (APT) family kinase protein
MKHDIGALAPMFRLRGDFVTAEPYGTGHINDTYAVTCEQAGTPVRYIFQRINDLVFTDPPALMENIVRTTRHIHEKLEDQHADSLTRRVLNLIPATRSDRYYHKDQDGNYWRVYMFIEGARTYDIIENDTQAFEAAKAFGHFQFELADLPPPRLNETVPDFHNTRARFDALIAALEADICGRAGSVHEEIAFVLEREPIVDVLWDLQARGELPERITHNDTKINNVMIDNKTSEGVCVIDLDTVMPGLALHDIGDMIRSGTNTAAEDEQDLSKVTINRNRYAALVRGYLAAAGEFLTAKEKELLVFSGKLITLETGMRFLTDHLCGDVYFKVHRAGHNLDRCRTQFKLVSEMEGQEDKLTQMVTSLCES